jgi:PAS domain S-box-containing protein
MKREISYEEIEKDIADLNGALKTIEKKAEVEKAINNIIGNVRFQTTELQKREAEIEETKNYLHETLEGLATPIWLLNKEGGVTYVNPIFEQIVGYKKEECIGNTLEEFMAKIISEKDAPMIADRVKKRLKSGEVSTNMPLTLFTKERKELPILYFAAPIRDIKGNIIGEVVSATDVTELRKREVELKNAKRRIEDIMNNLPIGVVTYEADDPEKKWKIVNPALVKITGYSVNEMLGRCTEVQPFNTDEATRIFTEQRKKYEEIPTYEIPWVTKTGEHIIVRVNVGDIKDAEGRITDYSFSVEDITKLRRQEAEVEESKALLEDLIKNIPDMIGVLDEEHKWVKVNPAWEKIWGWKTEEMLGKRTEEQSFMVPEKIKGLEERTKQRAEKLYSEETVEEESVFLAKDGSKRVGQFKEQLIEQ